MQFALAMQRLAGGLGQRGDEDFGFSKIEWFNRILSCKGTSGPTPFTARLDFSNGQRQISSDCSLCGEGGLCPHTAAMVRLVNKAKLADKIEQSGFARCSFAFNGKSQLEESWKPKLEQLTRQFSFPTRPDPRPARLPNGREVVYVIHAPLYSSSDDAIEIVVATRPLKPTTSGLPRKKPIRTRYRLFSSGVRALASSTDPIDREIAERITLVRANTLDDRSSRGQVRFSVSPETSRPFIARLAQSGRLYVNLDYAMNDSALLVSWLSDEPFELKFEISAPDRDFLSVGFCVVNSSITLPHDDLKGARPWFFVDSQNRLGIFARRAPFSSADNVKFDETVRVPRRQSAELIERVLTLRGGLGAEFIGCQELRPPTLPATPRPRIHISAPFQDSNVFEAEVHFDYDGVFIPADARTTEVYDKERKAIVQVDLPFHEKSLELLYSLDVKAEQGYGELHFGLAKKKLPMIVGQLIRQGWHVEAEGKLYRTGSKFDINIATGIDWFELQGKAHFDEASIDLPKLLRALRAGEQTVILDDGTVGVIPEQWMKQFGDVAKLASAEDGPATFSRSQVGLLDALLAGQDGINIDEQFAAARNALRGFERVVPQEPPEGFVGTLRPYQKLGLGWFDFLRSLGFGGCLADDMGLGKTIQVLAMLESRRQQASGPSLVVVPRSLIFNWIAEARKFTPAMRILDQSHSQRQRGTDHLSDFDLVLTTYGTLRRDAAFLKDFEFDYVILDEAQAIKNSSTEAAKAARLLHGRHRLALSGTPIENHLGELGSLFDFLNPGMLGRIGRFADIAQDADADGRKFIAAAVRPFILRRTKRQVAPDLPDRIEQTIVVELDPTQRKAYDELRDYYRKSLMDKIAVDGIGKSQIVILEALLRLRQAACHPGLIDKARMAEPSAKLDELLTRLTTALESGERVLVFSQFTSLLAIVKLRLNQAGIDFLYLDGQTRDRQSLVEQFQTGKGPAVFLISLKAGGVGLNLTAARTVYLLDPWWNPAVEAQAIDRSHRIGQEQTVFATRLIAADTVEQKVLELQTKKKGLADAIVNDDNNGISSLTREDLQLLLA